MADVNIVPLFSFLSGERKPLYKFPQFIWDPNQQSRDRYIFDIVDNWMFHYPGFISVVD